jgi:hypothetical protein
MSRTARDLTRTSAFDALYYDVRARFIVVASRRGAGRLSMPRASGGGGGGARHTASLTTARTHTTPRPSSSSSSFHLASRD